MPSRATKMLNYIRRPESKGNSAPGSPRAGSHDMTQQAHHQQMQQRQQPQAQHLLQQHKQQPQQLTPPHTQQQQQQQQAQPQRNQPQQQRALPQPHFSPPRAASRQTFESAKLPIPRLARYAVNQPASAPATTHSFGLHQRANSDGLRVHAPPPDANAAAGARGQHDAWEDSTVNSLLDSDVNSVTGHTRRPAVAYEPRPPPTSALPAPPRRAQPVKNEPVKAQPPPASDLDRPPFVFGNGGLLKVIDHAHGPGPSATTLDSSVQSGILVEAGQAAEDPYVENTDYETTPKKQEHSLKHSKLSIRPNRDVSRDTQEGRDRRASSVYSRQDRRFSGSPEPYNRARDDIRRVRLDSDTRGPAHLRSAQFYDIDPPGPRLAPEDDDGNLSDPPSQGEEATVTLHTRAPSVQPPVSPTKAVSKTRQPPPPAAQAANGIRPTSITRTSSNHGKLGPQLPAKKRRMSLDYDDHMLHRMSYSELRSEPFDLDPARTAAQPAKQPSSGDSLTERLEHYQGQDEDAQHQFFAQISVAEWDECGDWFLEQFGDIVGKIKKARCEKRKITAQYEEQISAREELIRGKMEYIEQTLFSLKQEGEVMMKGKAVDL